MPAPSSKRAKKILAYPDSDGKPMADNTLQFQWIVTVEGNLDGLFRDDPQVFVAGDLLWYPVLGELTSTAPDVLVAFGRPKGYRGSYRQWEEGMVAPQVVWEILSAHNTKRELDGKFAFYDRYGVEEYYFYDPYDKKTLGWLRGRRKLCSIRKLHDWVSPRLGIRFDLSRPELVLYLPDGKRFLSFVELMVEREHAQRLSREARRAQRQAERQAEQAQQQAEQAQQQAEQERSAREEVQRQAEQAQRQAEQAQRQAEQERARAEQLASRLRQLGIDPGP